MRQSPRSVRTPLHATADARLRGRLFATTVIAAAVLAACGGGGSGGSGGSGTTTPDATTPASTAPTPKLQVSGVAATGAALAGATITASCATGTGAATVAADGTYTLSIPGGALPCVLEASDGTTTLHSVAAGSGTGTATVNVTPLTELLVAHLTGQDPKTFFSGLSGGTDALATRITADAVSTASAAVITTLKDAGVDTTALSDLVGGELKAGTGSGYDGVLDNLKSTLTLTGATLASLTTAVATASPAGAATAASSTAANSDAATNGLLPASLLLRTKAADCAALRSGKYRVVVARPSDTTGALDPVTTTELATLDAAAAAGPTWTWEDGSSESMTPVAGQPCHYQAGAGATGTHDMLIAPSGIGFARSLETGDPSQRLVMLLPEQTIGVASLAGTWNALGWTPTNGVWGVDSPVVTVAADGKVTIACGDTAPSLQAASCAAAEGPYTGFTVHPAGGLDLTVGAPGSQTKVRAFAFQGGNGMKTIVLIQADGTVMWMTPQREGKLAALGETWNAWNIQVAPSGVAADALAYNAFEVTAADATAKSITRKVTSKATGVSHAQTLVGDTARTGWAYRAAATATGSDNSAVTVREMYALRTGLGFTAYWLPTTNGGSNARLGISVNQP